jgi:hypothetical protein
MTRPILLIDGNNLGHVLGCIDKATGHYDGAGLLAWLDGAARGLVGQGQETEIVLFLDDVYAAERLGGWHVRVAPVPSGDADAAIRTYAEAHANRPQILVSGDQALCGDVALWGVVCLSPETFISRYLIPARQAGYIESDLSYVEASEASPEAEHAPRPLTQPDQREAELGLQAETLARAEAILRGQPLPAPDVYRLELERWADEAQLALYLAQHHLCPAHPELTDPAEMVEAICTHCSRQPRYFTAGPVIDRVFRLFLCRAEHTLSLDGLTRLAHTRRRKVKAALEKHGERLGIVAVWV